MFRSAASELNPQSRNKLRALPPALSLIAAVLIVVSFMPGFPGGFLFDDFPTIVEQPLVQPEEASAKALWDAAFAFHPNGGFPRPLANVTFAINYLIDGLNPAGFRAGNLLLHILNFSLLALWIGQLFRTDGATAGFARTAGIAVAALWALHPLQVSTVLYVVQRMEIMCLTFSLLALIAYTSARTKQMRGGGTGVPALILASCAAGLALLCKESGALIAVFGILLEALVFRFRAADARWARAWRILTITGATLGALVFSYLTLRIYQDPLSFIARDYGPTDRLIAQLDILNMYLGQIVLPRPDSMLFYYDHLIADGTWRAGNILGALMLIGLIGLIVALRRRRPLAAFGLALFLACHLITSAAWPLELVFEHRNYFAIAGILLAVVALPGPWLSERRNRRLVVIAGVMLALSLATLTALRAANWSSPVRLAAQLAQINPGSTRAAMDMAEQYMLAANHDPESPYATMALQEYARAAALPQTTILGEHGLILMATSFDIPVQQAWWDSAVWKLTNAPLRPQDMEIVLGMLEHRDAGTPLNDTQMARVTLAVTRNHSVAPQVIFFFAERALLADDGGAAAAELFARGLYSIVDDAEYSARARHGITRVAGAAFLARVDDELNALQSPAAIEKSAHSAN